MYIVFCFYMLSSIYISRNDVFYFKWLPFLSDYFYGYKYAIKTWLIKLFVFLLITNNGGVV